MAWEKSDDGLLGFSTGKSPARSVTAKVGGKGGKPPIHEKPPWWPEDREWPPTHPDKM